MDARDKQIRIIERRKENKKMTVLSAIALATGIFSRIAFWDNRPNVEHISIILFIVILCLFQLYLARERHTLASEYKKCQTLEA